MVETAFSLIPPLVVIALLVTTKRLVPSLTVGIVLGALMIANWNPVNAAISIGAWMWDVLTGEWKILTFALLVGALSAMLKTSGGVAAFAEWAYIHANTPRKAQLAVLIVGFFTFFSDGFSCLMRANVMRSLTDKHRISHAKLSYLVHSSSAPYALLIPISAIAGMSVAIISRTFEDIGMNTNEAFGSFIAAIPMNYYNILTILFVFFVAITGLNLGPMRKHERLARDKGILFDQSKLQLMREEAEAEGVEGDTRVSARGTIVDLAAPVFTLIGVAVVMAFTIAFRGAEGPITVTSFLQETDIVLSLIIGTVAAILLSAGLSLMKSVPTLLIARSAGDGLLNISLSVVILYLALVTAEVMKAIGVGTFLAGLINGSAFPIGLLPLMLFLVSAFMSYAMGSTLGTAGLMIPIGAQIVVAVDPWFLIPVIGSVFAGCVFGEHTSPLSDTTIMSSIGSKIDSFDHIVTQMPYAVVTSIASVVGYVVLGFTRSSGLGFLTALLTLVVLAAVAMRFYSENARSRTASITAEPTSDEANVVVR